MSVTAAALPRFMALK